jgi:KDO2-lipid IV(A) lauroyltransferase
MKNVLEYALFLFWSFFVRILGINNSRKLASFFTLIVFNFIPIRKKVTLDNLTHAFPEYSKEKIKEIAFQSYRSFIIALVEILHLPGDTEKDIINVIECSNKNLITEKYKENNGVILLSAHFGNWEYIALSVSLQLNIPFHVIVKPQRNPFVSDWLNKVRTKWINKIIPLGVSIRQVYKELKDKNIVAMVADQRGPAEGIKVNFFGRKTSVYPGPAMLALKTNSPIIYGIAVRQPDYSYISYLSEINVDNLPNNEEDKIAEISQRHMSFLEETIRKYPEQWLWMHNRWKH